MSISRRDFAKLLGAGTLGAALAPSFGRRVTAQPPMGPVRFLAIRTPHGVDRDWWVPKNGDGSDPRTADEALSGLTFDYDMAVLTPLMGWRDKITILDGLDTQCTKENTRAGVYSNHGHNEQGTMLTGAQGPSDREGNFGDGHPSLDFALHARLGAPVLLTSAVEGTGTWKCMSYDDAGRFRAPQADPRVAFRAAFPEGFVPPDPTEPAVDYANGERRIFGYDQSALEALEGRLSGSEADKIRAHIDAMAALTPEAGMGPGGMFVGSCTTSGSDVPSVGPNVGDYTNVSTVTRAHADVITQAFACGRARCATLQILNDFPNYYTDIPSVRDSGVVGVFGDGYRFHEDLVHSYWNASEGPTKDTIRRGYLAGLRWAAGNFALVLEALDSVVDPMDPNGGTILDNTIVYWHNEFGHDGHDNQHTRHPVVIAGGGGRTLRLGRYLRLRDIDSSQRVPHNKLLVSIAHALGQTDIDFFGDRDLSDRAEYRGPLEPLMV